MLQRGAAKQAYLCNVGRAHAGLTTFAFDAFDHGRLLAADVGARAPAQLDVRQGAWWLGAQVIQRRLQQCAAAVVFVAQVDVDGLGAHHLGRDEHAFQKTVWVALQIGAVLEGSRLAFVNVHGHHGRAAKRPRVAWGGLGLGKSGLLPNNAPLAPCRKPRTAQAAQARVLHGGQHGLGIHLAIDQRCGRLVAAVGAVGGQVGVGGADPVRLHRHTLPGQRRNIKIDSY